MFAELVELGKRETKLHPALAPCQCNYDIVIDNDGRFLKLIKCDKLLVTEYIPSTAKKGKVRLLLDKAEETLYGCDGYSESDISQSFLDKNKRELSDEYKKKLTNEYKEKIEKEQKEKLSDKNEKYLKYIIKLQQYKNIRELAPIFSFYNKPKEVEKALEAYLNLPKKDQRGNMTFMVDSSRPISLEIVQDAIKRKYETNLKSTGQNCAICGKNVFPILDVPHGGINLPGYDKKCTLVSYNEKAFESYNLTGNINSGICINCARNYVEGLSYLTKPKWISIAKDGKVKKKKDYKNAIELSDDTLITFWTKEPNGNIDPWSDICQPTVERVKRMFSSVVTGNSQRAETKVDNYFYCCTLSSAAARIAVRDWLAISVSQYQNNLKQWFDDIATIKDGEIYYPGINTILYNCIKKKAKPAQSDFKAKARIGTMLWRAALANTSLPLVILQSVLSQIEHDKSKYGCFNEEKSTVIRLVLNRYNKKKYKMKNELDQENGSKAYLCGRLFALICKLQFKAQGAVNNSIKDRFFASASNAPARVMGLLLTKYVPIYEKKTKGAYHTPITEIAAKIEHFPSKFSITERGEFALGYYYQYNKKINDINNE